MDLEALNRRRCARLIGQEVERMKARSVELFNFEASRSILTSELNFLAELRVEATPEEARELDAKVEGLQARLTRINAEALARADNDEVEASPDSPIEASGAESDAAAPPNEVAEYKRLFDQVLDRRTQHGENKTAVFEDWLREQTGIHRTQVRDYLAGNIKGHVSPKKCKVIEAAILASAAKLGLTTRTSSD